MIVDILEIANRNKQEKERKRKSRNFSSLQSPYPAMMRTPAVITEICCGPSHISWNNCGALKKRG
jgi:hypothetical protein